MTDTSQAAHVESLNFAIEYDGDALATHEMDVRDLAPALLSAADLFQTLNRLVHPTDREVQVSIRASEQGSFLVQLKVAYDQYVSFATNPGLVATEGLAGLIAIVVGLIRFKAKRGHAGPPSTTEQIEDGMVMLTWSDGTVLIIPADSVRLADNASVRRPLAAMVRPVERNGIDVVRLRQDGAVLGEVAKEDLPAFQSDGEYTNREVLSESDRETYLTIRNAPFDTGLRWRFSDGLGNFSAFVVDPLFNERIELRQEAFAKGDVLHCTLHTIQWRDHTGIHSDAEVTRVIEKVPPAEPDLSMF